MSRLARSIDAQAAWVAHFLHSRAAFIWLVYGTVLWIPFVVSNLDPHGFLYLYIATSLSLVTQVPLAMLAYWASRDAKQSEELTRQMLKNQTDMLKFLIAEFGEFGEEIGEIIVEIKEHHDEETDGVLPVVDPPLDVEEA
jgi:hypothetical protein